LHTGPWGESQFHGMAEGFDDNGKSFIASLYADCDEVNLSGFFAFELKRALDEKLSPLDDRQCEMVKRCRFLRRLEVGKAAAYLIAIGRSWGRVFDSCQPTVVISELIDSYVVDALKEECEKRNIIFYGLVTCFVNGYFRVTTYGEYRYIREPHVKEVEHVLSDLISPDYRPQFLSDADLGFKKKVFNRWFKNYFRILYLSYKCLFPSCRRINTIYGALLTSLEWVHPYPRFSLGVSDWYERSLKRDRPIVYIPLQHVPEATVDYWTDDVGLIAYENTLLKLIDKFGESLTFVVKEHPNVIGLRNPRFYDQLSEKKSVVFAKTTSSSNEIIDRCEAVLVWTGSAGFEAAVRGKPVLTLTEVYYMSGNRFMVIGDSTEVDDVCNFLDDCSLRPITYAEQFDMVRHLLTGLVRGRIGFMKNFDSVKNQYTSVRIIGDTLRKIYDDDHTQGSM